MREEQIPSQNLQNKFKEWFRDLIPAEIDHSIEDIVPEDPDPADFPFPAVVYNPYYINRSGQVKNSHKLVELFIFGLLGAVFVGIGVGCIILMIYISNSEWGNYWPSPIVVICLTMVVGFLGGLLIGSIYKLHEKYSYKDGF